MTEDMKQFVDELEQLTEGKKPTLGKILVVDDSPVVRDEMRAHLESLNYEVHEGMNGAEGLRLARRLTDLRLIFLDVNMPEMDGLMMAETYAADLAHKRIVCPAPIVMLTAESNMAQVLRAKKSGVTGWIIKPAKREHIVSIVGKAAKKPAA